MTVIGLVESIVLSTSDYDCFLSSLVLAMACDGWQDSLREMTTPRWQTDDRLYKIDRNCSFETWPSAKMTAWPKKAQIIADFINCTIASSAVTIVIFQVQNHVVMLRYVIATRLDVAYTSMPSLSGIVLWANITSKWYFAIFPPP